MEEAESTGLPPNYEGIDGVDYFTKSCRTGISKGFQVYKNTYASRTFVILRIGNLGGKFGAEVASVFESDLVSDIWNISPDQLRSKLGQEQGSWVYNICQGIDYSEVITRTKIKSMLR